MNSVEVSIICNAYNHEPFIRKCLDGFVMQETNFAFEVLIHDDASTDNTADIIREYEKKYPELIKPIYQVENQYSKGGISQFQYPRVSGKYIAFCEGDDYWTDPQKLQKQYDAMEKHPEVDICAHAAALFHYTTGQVKRHIAPKGSDCIIPVEEVIAGGGGYVVSSSLFYRSELNKNMPQFREKWKLDYCLQIQGALRGGMLYLADSMSVYQYMTPGSWSTRFGESVDRQKKYHDNLVRTLNLLNKETGYKYKEVIEDRVKTADWNYLWLCDRYTELLEPRFKEFRRKMTMKKRIKLYLKLAFPWLYKIKRYLEGRQK